GHARGDPARHVDCSKWPGHAAAAALAAARKGPMTPEIDDPRGAAAVPHPVLKVSWSDAVETVDHLAVEEPLEVRLGGLAFTVTMRPPGHDEDLVAGLLLSEGLIRGTDNLDVIARYPGPVGEAEPGNVINVLLKGDVQVARERLRRSLVASSA